MKLNELHKHRSNLDLLAIGDLHLGPFTMDVVCFDTLIQAIDKAYSVSHQAKDSVKTATVFLGDVMDKLSPLLKEIKYAIHLFSRIKQRFGKAIVIPGNHDNLEALEILEAADLITLLPRFLDTPINLKDSGIGLFTCPDLSEGANNPSDMVDGVLAVADNSPYDQNIVIGHLPVLFESTRMMEEAVDPKKMYHEKLSLWTLGDIHLRFEDTDNGVFVPGSCVFTGYDELENPDRSIVLFRFTDEGNILYSRIKSDNRERAVVMTFDKESDYKSKEPIKVSHELHHIKIRLEFPSELVQWEVVNHVKSRITPPSALNHLKFAKPEIMRDKVALPSGDEAIKIERMSDEELMRNVMKQQNIDPHYINDVVDYHNSRHKGDSQ